MNRQGIRTSLPSRRNLSNRGSEPYGARMRFKVLGPLQATGSNGPVPLGGPKQRAVLAHLVVRANELVPADTLIDLVWTGDPPEAARGTIHSYISHLRKALGPDRIEGRPPGYVLHVGPDELDAALFEQLLREARLVNGSPARAGTLLREGLALWTGPAFADLSSEPSLAGEIARLDELRLQALEERIAADLAEGRHGEVIGELEAVTREMPLRERLWELLMLALYRARRPADALAAFERARDVLARELGVDPSADLRRLHERILREDPDLDLEGEPLRGYRLLEQVGEGAFGVVYRAIQPQVGREVAIKAVHPELANHPDFVRRFDHEAQIVARLEHPHVVPLYDYWREPNAAYLVMRFLRGGSVEELLEAGPLDPARVVSDHGADRVGARRRPPTGRRTSRRQARQRASGRGGQRLPHGLRCRPRCRFAGTKHRHDDARNARLPVARADPARAGKPSVRCVRARDRGVRDVDGRAPFPGDVSDGVARPSRAGRAPLASHPSSGPASRRRRGDQASDREGRRRAVPGRHDDRCGAAGRVGGNAHPRPSGGPDPEPVQGPARVPGGGHGRLLRARGRHRTVDPEPRGGRPGGEVPRRRGSVGVGKVLGRAGRAGPGAPPWRDPRFRALVRDRRAARPAPVPRARGRADGRGRRAAPFPHGGARARRARHRRMRSTASSRIPRPSS